MAMLLIQVKTPVIGTDGETKYLFAGNFTRQTDTDGAWYVSNWHYGVINLPCADDNIKMVLELNEAGVAALDGLREQPFAAVLV